MSNKEEERSNSWSIGFFKKKTNDSEGKITASDKVLILGIVVNLISSYMKIEHHYEYANSGLLISIAMALIYVWANKREIWKSKWAATVPIAITAWSLICMLMF